MDALIDESIHYIIHLQFKRKCPWKCNVRMESSLCELNDLILTKMAMET